MAATTAAAASKRGQNQEPQQPRRTLEYQTEHDEPLSQWSQLLRGRWRRVRRALGHRGSITAIRRDQGMSRSIPAWNFSRRVRFFFKAYSALAKLSWLTAMVLQFSVSSGLHGRA